MGQTPANGGLAPFNIYFNYVVDGQVVTDVVEPFGPEPVPCYEAISVKFFFMLTRFFVDGVNSNLFFGCCRT